MARSTAAYAVTDRETRHVFGSFTVCVARLHPKDAAEVVLSTASAEEILKAHPKLVTPDCLDASELVMPGSEYLRYGLAEALVRREYRGGLPIDIAQAGPIPHFQGKESDYQPKPGKTLKPKELAQVEMLRKRDDAFRALSIYGECVVRADPTAALRLVLSSPDSPQESTAFGAMRTALSSCLTQGVTISLDRVVLRGTAAMNLYRLAHAPKLQPAAPSK